jgi:drug/metabolite transporter (DMT)-like permease
MKQFKKTPFYPLALLLCLGLTWGTSFSIARFAMESGITPLGYLFWQTVGPACLLFLLIFFIQKRHFAFTSNQLIFYIITGFFGILLPNYCMFESATHVPSGILGLIVNTSPIITYLLSLAFLLEKFQIRRFCGVLLALFGLYMLFAPKANFAANLGSFWILFAFLTPFFLALCTVFIVKFKPNHTNSLELACGMLIAASIIVIPVTFLKGQFHPLTTLNTPNLIILLEIGLSSLGFVLFFELLRVSGPVYYSLVSCLVALSGLGWGYLVFHETLVGTEIIAILSVVSSIYLVGNANQTTTRK